MLAQAGDRLGWTGAVGVQVETDWGNSLGTGWNRLRTGWGQDHTGWTQAAVRLEQAELEAFWGQVFFHSGGKRKALT